LCNSCAARGVERQRFRGLPYTRLAEIQVLVFFGTGLLARCAGTGAHQGCRADLDVRAFDAVTLREAFAVGQPVTAIFVSGVKTAPF